MGQVRRVVLGIVMLFGSSPAVLGQSLVTGTVQSGDGPIAGANVAISSTDRGVATNARGTFRLANLSPGRHELVISAVGYHTSRTTVALSSDDTVHVEIDLTERVIEGEEVVITGTLRKTRVKDSPVKVTVISPERLQQGRASSNLMDLIDRVGGLSTQLNCGVCGTNAIRINGVEGPNTAVLIDGMPLMGALASVYGLNGLSPSIIDRVEVIKGPQSTLYGTQALGGVVNIITKDPVHTPSVMADGYVTNRQEASLNLAASPSLGPMKGFVSGNVLRMEHYIDQNEDGFADAPSRSRLSLFGKGTVRQTDGEPLLNVAAKLYGEDRTGGTKQFSDDLRGSRSVYGESIYTRRTELLADIHPPGLDQHLHISGAFTYHDQDSYYGPQHYDAQQRIAYGQATWDQSLSEMVRVLTGTSLRYEVYNDNTPATTAGADRRLIPGIFGQMEASLSRTTLLAGMRFDHHTEHGIVTAPRLTAKYSPSERTTVRASSGTGFRVVNVFTEDHATLTGSREVVFTEDLDPERSRSLTASFEQIIAFRGNPLTISLDGFYTRFSNKIIPDYDQDPNLIIYEDLDGFSVTRGFSVDLDQNFTVLPFSYNLNVTRMDVYTQNDGNRTAVTYAPDYTGTLGLTYRIPNLGMSIDYGLNLIGPKRMPATYAEQFDRASRSPSHLTHDLKLTRAFSTVNDTAGRGLEAYLSIENILNFTQGTPLVNAHAPFSEDFDTTYTWGPVVGRTILLGVRLNVR